MEYEDIAKTPYSDNEEGEVPAGQEPTLQYPGARYPPDYCPQQYPMTQPPEYPTHEQSVNTSNSVHVTSYQFPSPNSDTDALVTPDPPPNDYLLGALLATFLCFWPTGIVAIVFAADARSAFARGDYLRGHEKARKARTLVIASVITGSVIIVFVVVFIIVLAMLGLDFY